MRSTLTAGLVAVICCLSLVLGVGYGQSEGAPMRKVVTLSVDPGPKTRVSPDRYQYRGVIRAQDAVKLAAMRQAGRQQDKSQVAMLVDSLNKPAHPMYPYAAMQALSKIGAVEAMPAFMPYLPKNDGFVPDDAELENFAQVAKARLLAENNSQGATNSKAGAEIKVGRFYKELGLTFSDLNTHPIMVSSLPYNLNGGFFATSAPSTRTREGFAMRELADMVYEGNYQDYASLPEVSGVDFTRDYCSALKMRLAPLSRQDRIATTIQELSHKMVLKNEDSYEIQLAINEGLPASQAAAMELKKMDKRRDIYNQVGHNSGFNALFQIIWGVGDKDQAQLIAQFRNDQNDWVAYYAQIVYNDVKVGVPRQPIWGY